MADVEPDFFCVCCQNRHNTGAACKDADGDLIPVCDLCWVRVPHSARIKLAQDYRQAKKTGKALDAITELVAWTLRENRGMTPWTEN